LNGGYNRQTCFDGQGSDPNEQNTQQSPGFGVSITPHAGQGQKWTHALDGIVSTVAARQLGQVRVLVSRSIRYMLRTSVRGGC
jgi:hypothetical protein